MRLSFSITVYRCVCSNTLPELIALAVVFVPSAHELLMILLDALEGCLPASQAQALNTLFKFDIKASIHYTFNQQEFESSTLERHLVLQVDLQVCLCGTCNNIHTMLNTNSDPQIR